MTIAATGSLTSITAATFSINPTALTNFFVVDVITQKTTVSQALSISSSNCAWYVLAGPTNSSHLSGTSVTTFLAVPKATGSQTATITFSNGTPTTIRGSLRQFTTSVGAVILDASATLDSAGTNVWPSLTGSGTGAGYLYAGHMFNQGTGSAGSTSGYTYTNDANGNTEAYNVAYGGTPPTCGDSGQQFGHVVLLKEFNPFVRQIGKTTGNGLSSVQVVPSGSATTLHNQILVTCVWQPVSGSSYPTCAITDSAGNTYTVLDSFAGSGSAGSAGPAYVVAVCYDAASVPTSTGFIKATFTGAASFSIFMVDELTGCPSLNGSLVKNPSLVSASAITLGSLPINQKAIGYTLVASAGNLTATTWTPGWTPEFQSATPTLSQAYAVPPITSTLSGTATLQVSEPCNWVMFSLGPTTNSPATANGVTATRNIGSAIGRAGVSVTANGVTATRNISSAIGAAGVSATANGVTAIRSTTSAAGTVLARAKAIGVTAIRNIGSASGAAGVSATANGVTATRNINSATGSVQVRATANGVTATRNIVSAAGSAGVSVTANGVTATRNTVSAAGTATAGGGSTPATANGVTAIRSITSAAGRAGVSATANGVTAIRSTVSAAGSVLVRATAHGVTAIRTISSTPGTAVESRPATANGVTATRSTMSQPGTAGVSVTANGVTAIRTTSSPAGSVKAAVVVFGVTATRVISAHAGTVTGATPFRPGRVTVTSYFLGRVEVSDEPQGTAAVTEIGGGRGEII